MEHIKLASALGYEEKALEGLGWIKLTSGTVDIEQREVITKFGPKDGACPYCGED